MKLCIQRSDGFYYWGAEQVLDRAEEPREVLHHWGPKDPERISFFDGTSALEHDRAQLLVNDLNRDLAGERDDQGRLVFCHRRYFAVDVNYLDREP